MGGGLYGRQTDYGGETVEGLGSGSVGIIVYEEVGMVYCRGSWVSCQ